MGAYLSPSAVIGLGEWGRTVALGAEAALKERSPVLARACPVLTLDELEPAVPELIRAHLRASRMADMIRAMEQEGLMRLDPVISPATYLYLVVSLADDPELALLRDVAELVAQAASELKATVLPVALLDLGEGGRPPASFKPGFPLYVLEPVTGHGLVLDPAEYQAAVTEALVAVAQPGGSSLLAAGRPGLGTLGIAWLTWSPADLRASLAERLTSEALLRCLEEQEPAPQFRAGLRETEPWRAVARRSESMLVGVPFHVGLGGDVAPEPDLFGSPDRPRHQSLVHLKRCAAVLERRLGRWEQRLDRNAARQAEAEAAALEGGVAAALAAGAPDGLARARLVAESLAREAAERQDGGQAPDPAQRVGPALRRLEQAEKAPPPHHVAAGLTAAAFLFGLLWRLIAGGWGGLAVAAALAAAGVLAYWLGRPRRVAAAAHAAREALEQRAADLLCAALAHRLQQLDDQLEARAAALAADLARAAAGLAGRCRADAAAAGAPQPGAPRGALCFPLLSPGAADPLYHDLRGRAPDLAERMAGEGCLRHWREPDRMLEQCRAVTARFLSGQPALDPAQLATRAYGDRLAEHLQRTVQGLLDWSRPLLARTRALPEGQRWLLWPEGLPCPPVDRDVQVLTTRSCAAAITVVEGLPAAIWSDQGRSTAS